MYSQIVRHSLRLWVLSGEEERCSGKTCWGRGVLPPYPQTEEAGRGEVMVVMNPTWPVWKLGPAWGGRARGFVAGDSRSLDQESGNPRFWSLLCQGL